MQNDLHLDPSLTPSAEPISLRAEDHLGLVYTVASEIINRIGSDTGVEFDDLVGAGTVGLMEALANFDSSRGLAFSTFAVPRIRGAIYDQLRQQSGAPRAMRKKERRIEGARHALAGSLHREPTTRELADELGVEPETLARWKAEVEALHAVPLDQAVPGYSDRGPGTGSDPEALRVESGAEVEDRLTYEQEIAFLKDAVLDLDDRERNILSLYYYEDVKLADIARLLGGITEQRVGQIRKKAEEKLHRRMRRLRVA